MIEACNYAGVYEKDARYCYRIRTPFNTDHSDVVWERRDWCTNHCVNRWYDRWFRQAFPLSSTERDNYFLFESLEDATHFFLVWGSHV